MPPIRILLADDEADWLEDISDFLSVQPDIEVVAQTNQPTDITHLVEQSLPDLICLDLVMDGLDGLQIAHLLRWRALAPILMVSAHLDRKGWNDVLNAGIRGYVAKSTIRRELVPAIQTVFKGGTWFPAIMQAALKDTEQLQQQRRSQLWNQLTPRERDLCLLLRDGLGPSQLAQQLQISPETVKTHLRKLRQKFEVDDTFGLVGALRRYF